ncbi:calcium-binding protein P-like [Leptidea sinapis]|uniref:Uncharacterized protein n=1 Tax=Leptidea sinapis TaxID=189913 RepID=A0A5E4QT72_9NEOP|nr:calcium-binding protein P-like [Leptidea sinapis]VVD00391.1 unnamed protein product [Leptidea sinapis]
MNPQYPGQHNPIYPQIYNPSTAPGQPGQPMVPGQIQYGTGFPQNVPYPYQPGFAVYPGQVPGQAGSVPPSAMSYPNIQPTAPMYGYPGAPSVTPQQTYSAVEWIPTTPQAANAFSDRAVVAGYEGYDRSPLWVIRARFEGDLIPGKLAIKHHSAYVPWGGKENPVQSIEICCASPDRIRWVENRDGMIPPNAIAAGITTSGEPLYVGRAREQGSLTPGKVQPSHKVMYLSFAGNEIAHKVYEILCSV